MITLLHMSYRGGLPHLLLYSLTDSSLQLELPIAKDKALRLKAGGCKLHCESPASPK